ncbi:MAG: hypothetical protein JSV62_09555 [Promethearchaeota archaeon]|nr:MAG: hypothetical protein JSV62_09555 [Candidatus Lokiarchaeota archaeon]
MNTKQFIDKLNKIQKLMNLKKYKEAIILIEQLKELEKRGNFGYNLTHRLYQMDSNSHSLYNQQLLLKFLNELSKLNKSISFQELAEKIHKNYELNLKDDILRREIELLILRNQLKCRIEGDKLIF